MMSLEFKTSICIPSYKRPRVETLDYLPMAKVFVDHSEYDDYVENNPEGSNIVSCPEGVQGNVARIRNYILDTEFEKGADVVCILDDDMKGLYYWENTVAHLVEPEMFEHFIYKYTVMAIDMGVYYWGVNINKDKQVYNELSPFSFLRFIGGPFGCHLAGSELRYDEALPLKEDYDMTIQHLNKYRRVLRVNKFYYDVRQSTNVGGCASIRSFRREKQQFRALQEKWGSNIVRQDKTDKSNKDQRSMDYNPIIRVPIKGV